MATEVWLRRKAKEFAVRSKVINTQGELLPPLSITKGRGVILQSDKYKKQIATDLRKYVVARLDQFAFDPMSLYYGAIGHVTSPEVGLVSPDYVVFDVDSTVDKSFMNFLLRSPEQIANYEAVAETGNQFGKRRRVYWSVFEQLEFMLPPVREQRKIAHILSSVDDAVEATQAVIDQLQLVKKAMMVELLMLGLPGKHTRFKQTDIGEVPDSWAVVPLEDLAVKITDGEHQTPKREDAGVLLLSARNVLDGELSLKDVDYIGETEYLRIARRCKPEQKDVLISCSGSIGRVCLVPAGIRFGLVRSVALVKLDHSRVLPEFAEQMLRSEALQVQMQRSQKQAAQPNLFQGAIRVLKMPLPSMDEQRHISATLTSLDARVARERGYLGGLRSLKSALMSVLLTGELRVTPDPERV